MGIVPALDLRDAHPNDPEAPGAKPLANLEAEQALLGCLLYDNSALERVDDWLSEEHFFEPLHGRLWAEMAKAIRAGKLAEPVLLESKFRADQAFEEMGGIRYLAQLLRSAPPAINAADYGNEILDMALRRRVERACQGGIREARNFERTAKEINDEVEQALFEAAGASKAKQGFISFDVALRQAIEMAAEAYSRDGSLAGVSTGLIDLDQKIGGMHPSDLMILAARPSMGKTSLACNIAFDVAKHYAYEQQPDGSRKTTRGGIVAFFSLEMSAEQLAMRLLAEASGVSGDRIRKGEIDPMEFGRIRDAALEIQDCPLFIDATGGLSLDKLVARARRLKRSVGLDLIIVDYLQLVTAQGENRVAQVSNITQGLKAAAKELNVPVFALSQLSRQVENRDDKKPQLSDLRESGSIEQDADMVMFVYREEYYLSRLEPKAGTPEHQDWQTKMSECRGLAELIIGKQRHGPIGTIRVSFNENTTKFGNLARDSLRSPDHRQTGIDFSQPRNGE